MVRQGLHVKLFACFHLVEKKKIWRLALITLRNPRYAGAFVFGRTKTRKRADGSSYIQYKPLDEWDTLIPDAHPGYITWEAYNDNLWTLKSCAKAHGTDRRDHPPGEGPALLQGMVVCGVCGRRMTIRYHQRSGETRPDYVCQQNATEYAVPTCQTMAGSNIDKAIGQLLLELVQPITLELALHVQHEVQNRLEEADAIRHQSVERAQYQADLARERFMSVDPRNRLVADQLEADWNEKLRAMGQARQRYEEQREKDRIQLDDDARRKILSLARDFPRIWNDPSTTDKQRKRMFRLLIEDVTLTRTQKYARLQIRLRGGQTRTLEVPHPLSRTQLRKTPEQIVKEIDALLDHYTDGEISQELNRRGIKPPMGQRFNASMVAKLRRGNGLNGNRVPSPTPPQWLLDILPNIGLGCLLNDDGFHCRFRFPMNSPSLSTINLTAESSGRPRHSATGCFNSTSTSLRRMGGGVQGGLYWASIGSPTVSTPSRFNQSKSVCFFSFASSGETFPENRTTAKRFAGTSTSFTSGLFGLGSVSMVYLPGMTNDTTRVPDFPSCSITGAVISIFSDRTSRSITGAVISIVSEVSAPLPFTFVLLPKI